MYKLIHFKATNVIGFQSGLNKKVFDLDLSQIYDKGIIAVLGENGTGKSTFMSLIHPVHMPTDKRSKFIVEGKEGSIVREYVGDDGTTIVTKALYSPKKDGHSAKLYFKVIKPDDEEVELNPSGNVASYNELLFTYMGVSKDYVAFASYNDLVRGIVDMTDTERKLNVSSLIPNTKRFETTYGIINDKYRDLRNTIRNISQKITQLDDKDTLEERMKRLEASLASSRKERDSAIKRSSKLEGQLKEMTGGKSADELAAKNRRQYDKVLELYSSMQTSITELRSLVFDLGKFNSEKISELIKEGEALCEKLPSFEIKYAKTVAEAETYGSKVIQYRNQISDLEKELSELQATMYGLQTQDIGDLTQLKKDAEHKIKSMQWYDPKDARYGGLSFEESVSISNQLAIILSMTQSLLERYGELFTGYYHESPLVKELLSDEDAGERRAAAEQHEHDLYRQIATKEQYRSLQDILNKRPSDCVDDTCPFISNALQWNHIQKELDVLKARYVEATKFLEDCVAREENVEMAHRFVYDEQQLSSLVGRLAPYVHKYSFGKISLTAVVRDMSTGNLKSYYDLQDSFKRVSAALSEKTMYDDIMNNQLPKISASIQLAENSQINRTLLERNISKVEDRIHNLREEMNNAGMSVVIVEDVQNRTLDKLVKLRRLRELVKEADSSIREFGEQEREYKTLAKTVEGLADIQAEISEYKEIIRVMDARIKEFGPAVDATRYSIQQLAMLKLDEATETHRFMILDIVRSIVQPGKGLWKEAIDIYMSEINTIANQVLRNTFGGDLTLDPFELTDKSFFMPYVFNGSRGPDISFASSSQRATVATAISMAIISKMVDRYSTITLDEFDATLSPSNKEIVTEVLVNSMKILGIGTTYVITHNPENYEKASVDTGYIIFPGGKLSGKKNKDYVEV